MGNLEISEILKTRYMLRTTTTKLPYHNPFSHSSGFMITIYCLCSTDAQCFSSQITLHVEKVWFVLRRVPLAHHPKLCTHLLLA